VNRQEAFAEADSQASGRIAIFRACNEIGLTHPRLLDNATPTLSDIGILESRYAAYSAAREQALDTLAKILYKIPVMRTGRALPHDEVALGVPYPPDDVPRHLYVARLDALGLCSPELLAQFVGEELPNLKASKREEFEQMRQKPRYGKEPYAGLQVWLLENRPIFEHELFGWQWGDIQTAANERNIPNPPTGLKQWAQNHRLSLRLKRGPATIDNSRIVRSAPLLSSRPVFSDILKSASTRSVSL
jgi:hypothetical protein